MKLSTKGRYGLRAIIDLALNEEEGVVSLQSIAVRQKISVTYLEQLFRKMKVSKLVKSVRGAGGGYILAKPSETISVGDVLRSLEGNLLAVQCGGTDDNESCDLSDLCVTKFVWRRINESIEQAVDSITIDELVEKSRESRKKGQVEVQACANRERK